MSLLSSLWRLLPTGSTLHEEEPAIRAGSVLTQLQSDLIKVQEFLPAREISSFNPDHVTLTFDAKNLHATNLSNLFDILASSFWCEKEVQELYVKHKAPFDGILIPRFKAGMTTDDGARAVSEMATLMTQLAPQVMDRNLERVWEKVVRYHEGIPALDSAEKIREWMRVNPSAIQGIKTLNLTQSEIEILPPEILQFSNLESIYLIGSKLGQFPHVLKVHPNSARLFENEHLCEDLTFHSGTTLLG